MIRLHSSPVPDDQFSCLFFGHTTASHGVTNLHPLNGQPGERLGVHMADWQGADKLFDASLSLQRQPLNRSSLHRHLLSFPWMTGKTVLAIYWQALRLLL